MPRLIKPALMLFLLLALPASAAWGLEAVKKATPFEVLLGAPTDNAALSAALGAKADKTTTVNGHALSGNVTVSAADAGAPPTSRTVNGHALSGDITVTSSDVGLGSVANALQVQAVSPADPADGAYVAHAACLVRIAGTGGLSKFQLVYQTATASTVLAAKGDAYVTSDAIGIVVANAAEGASVTILRDGLITNAAWSWTPGAQLYVSDVTAGLITATPPTTGHFQKMIARAKTATTIQMTHKSIVGVP